MIIVDGQKISSTDVLGLLERGGALADFLGSLLSRLIIERELERRPDLAVPPLLIDLAETEFLRTKNLADHHELEIWLHQHGRTREALRSELRGSLQLEKLKLAVTADHLESYSRERAPFLDRVALSRIAVRSENTARHLWKDLMRGAPFEALAREHSIGREKRTGGSLGLMLRTDLTGELAKRVAAARPGDILGPMQIEDAFALFRLDEHLPCTLEDPAIKNQLREELFQRWIGEQFERLQVEI